MRALVFMFDIGFGAANTAFYVDSGRAISLIAAIFCFSMALFVLATMVGDR